MSSGVIVPPRRQRGRVCLSFYNLVECHVLAAIRREHGVTLQRVRRALAVVRKRQKVQRPLLDQDFETGGVDLFVRELDRLVRVSEGDWQYAIREAVEASLRRVERDANGLPIRLFPFVGPARADAPRIVEVDPSRAFGRPTLTGTGIPTAEIASRARAVRASGATRSSL